MGAAEIAQAYWRAIDARDWVALEALFAQDARVYWPNTGEVFPSPALFARANAAYPGAWGARMEKVESTATGAVSVALVSDKDGGAAFYAVAFFTTDGERITALTEYWGDCGDAPAWRGAYAEAIR
jgi:ketosteroid isomerase-like protein